MDIEYNDMKKEPTIDELIVSLEEQAKKLRSVVEEKNYDITTLFRYTYGLGDDVKLDAKVLECAAEVDNVISLLNELKTFREETSNE